MSMTDSVWIGVDIGGTKVLAGVVDDEGRIRRTARRATPGRRIGVDQIEDALVAAVLEAADGAPIAGVGVAAAGFVDAAGERVMFAPHLPWQGEDVRKRLSQRWGGVPVSLDNDANYAALAEWTYGAARGARSAVVVTVGTGIGGALVLDGHLLRGANGMAGEFGHMQVVPGGHPCECGGHGCWEQYCSGSALVRFVRQRMLEQPSLLVDATGGNPDLVTGPMITEAAAAGDLVATEAFASVGEWLGVGVANLVAAIDPELVVVGGGVCAAGDLLLGPARTAMACSLVGAAHRVVPHIVAAQLGPEAGLVGAAVAAQQAGRTQRRR